MGRLDEYDIDKSEYLGGSTGAYLYTSEEGKKYVIKKGANAKQLYSEFMANKVYESFGIKVPKAMLTKDDYGNDILVTEYLEGSIPLGYTKETAESLRDDVAKGFIIDVLTANWDVVGTDYDLSNIRIYKGRAYRVDLGGALLTRAMGADKNFSHVPTEHDTLLDPEINRNTAYIFSVLDKKKIGTAVRKHFKDYLVDGKLDKDRFRRMLDESIGRIDGFAK